MVDWSRAARNERKLMEAAEDVNQGHITDYYSILDDIGTLAKVENFLKVFQDAFYQLEAWKHFSQH